MQTALRVARVVRRSRTDGRDSLGRIARQPTAAPVSPGKRPRILAVASRVRAPRRGSVRRRRIIADPTRHRVTAVGLRTRRPTAAFPRRDRTLLPAATSQASDHTPRPAGVSPLRDRTQRLAGAIPLRAPSRHHAPPAGVRVSPADTRAPPAVGMLVAAEADADGRRAPLLRDNSLSHRVQDQFGEAVQV